MITSDEEFVRDKKKILEFLHEKRRVDLVNFGDLKFFVYIDDMMYSFIPDEMKNYQFSKKDAEAIEAGNFELLPEECKNNLYYILFSHYWKENLEFTLIDIGCPYGITAIINSHLIRRSHHHNRVIMFEPGLTSDLVPHNVRINNVQDTVTFENMAVSDHNFPVIMWTTSSHTEGNRIVNRDPQIEDSSFVVNSTTLDDYIYNHKIETNFIVKIDTEGAENEVYSGFINTLKNRYSICIWEFSPQFLSTRINPLDFLKKISTECSVFDLGQDHFNSVVITPVPVSEFKKFVAETLERPQPWTDILVVPRNIPGFDNLCRDLMAIGKPKTSLYPSYSKSTNGPESKSENIFQFGKGWFKDEGEGRWMGEKSEIFVLRSKEGIIDFKFFIPKEIFEKVYQGEIFIDISTQSEKIYSDCYSIKNYESGIIPVSLKMENRSDVLLTINLKKFFIPKKEGICDDSRKLGLMLLEVK
jgi:FkbM family methyltransferase